LHVLAPIRPEVMFPDVRRLRRRSPRRSSGASTQRVATTTWRVADRVGVFVDFGQNARDRTIVALRVPT
jgi:DNA primase